MADIELVIKIPKGLKNDFESEQWTALSCMEMKNALEKATPLPEGHGDLIDRDWCLKMKCTDLVDSDGVTMYAVPTGNILKMIPVVPAEKGEA